MSSVLSLIGNGLGVQKGLLQFTPPTSLQPEHHFQDPSAQAVVLCSSKAGGCKHGTSRHTPNLTPAQLAVSSKAPL